MAKGLRVLLTSNQPRHLAAIETLAALPGELWVIQECRSQSGPEEAKFPAFQRYFERLRQAEEHIFGKLRFLPSKVHGLALKAGELAGLSQDVWEPIFRAEVIVVFGANPGQGALSQALLERGALYLHMGLAPYYRGGPSNFWALYDRRPEYVGATIQLYSPQKDAGAMLQHCLPAPEACDPFVWGMKAAAAGIQGLAQMLRQEEWRTWEPLPQNPTQILHEAQDEEFTPARAAEYLNRLLTPEQMQQILDHRHLEKFLRVFIHQ